MAASVDPIAVPDPRDLELSRLRAQLADLKRERDFYLDMHIGDARARRARDPDREDRVP